MSREQLLQCMYTCTEWRNSNWWLSSTVLCGITPDWGRRCFCMLVRSDYDSCPESSYLVLGVGPPEWLLWLWALQWVFIIHREWIWNSKHIAPSRNRFDITASVGLHRRCHLQLQNSIYYIGAYMDLHKEIRIKSGYPDLAWKKEAENSDLPKRNGYANTRRKVASW